jgi:predicted transcriptional regulator
MKRSRSQIVAEILETCTNGANKTRIVYQANLNFKTVNPYLQNLMDNHLIDLDQGEYQITSQGMKLLERLNRVNDILFMDSMK